MAKKRTKIAKKKTGRKKRKAIAKKVIGFMHSGSESNSDHIKPFKSLADALDMVGYDASKVNFIKRYAKDDPDKLEEIARELVNKGVDVLVAAGGSASAKAAEEVTIVKEEPPVVFTSVAEPTRRADHITGICARTSEFDPKRLYYLHELLPEAKNFGVLLNARRYNLSDVKSSLNTKAALLGLEPLDFVEIDPTEDVEDQINQAFASWDADDYKGVLVGADPLFNNHRNTVVAAAQNNRLPAIYQWREFVDAGGLMSYGTNLSLAYKLAGIYVGRILGRKQPIDLPVLPLGGFDLILNLRTATDLGIIDDIPAELLAQVDDVVWE